MASANDWAAKAARHIIEELPPHRGRQPREERIAAIIATFAEPLLKLLQEARREHDATYLDEGNDHEPCPKHYDEDAITCTCGANEWNARIDAVITGKETSDAG